MNTKTKTIMNISVLTFLLVAASSQCFAEMTVEQVSKERAKELGMAIRTKANGPNDIWVELEFRPEGKFKDFSHVSLEIREGRKLLVGYAALREKRSSPGSVVVNFIANRVFLDKITLTVVVADVPLGGSGYELRVKDFVELVQERSERPEDKAHREWLAKIIKETETIKVGMTRREVENVLVEDVGGFVNPKTMRYQHPACSCIKLDLEFELAVSGDRKDDKIVKRSMPLLDLVPNKARW